ncbi:MAG: hypothetical protein HUJ27_01880 [Rhodobacteraceae bacterium]|nr:hypothetical protein [Paracoccaceae bacterium]
MTGNTETGAEGASVALEFVIGVTGHRDIAQADLEAVCGRLRDGLSLIRDRFSDLPVTVITGLAEGADQLATEVALDLGLRVRAVLPMPKPCYEADFKGEALERFQTLHDDPRVTVHELPLAEGRGPADMESQANRDAQYALLRDYLVRRSNAMMAVWDGIDNGLTGGTSDVVMSYLGNGGAEAPASVSAEVETSDNCGNAVIWVPARRVSDPEQDLGADCKILISNTNYDCYSTHTELPEALLRRWEGLETYAAAHASDEGRDLPEYGLGADKAQVSADGTAIERQFLRADQLASANQKNSDLMFKLFGLFAAAMGLSFLVYAKLVAAKALLIIYVALFGLGYLGFRVSAQRHWLGCHLAYRAYAETLRVQFFLVLSGAGERYSVRRILGLINVDHFERFEWLQDAVRCAEPLTYGTASAPEDAIDATRALWIEDQAGYFGRKLHALHHQHELLERVKTALLAGSVLGALALIFFKKSLLYMDFAGFDGKTWLVFFMGLLPLWVAIWELYQGKMATRELLWQYANQRRYFAIAAQEIQAAQSAQAKQGMIRDLADRALVEIYLWSVHRYHREHEPPAAG